MTSDPPELASSLLRWEGYACTDKNTQPRNPIRQVFVTLPDINLSDVMSLSFTSNPDVTNTPIKIMIISYNSMEVSRQRVDTWLLQD